MDLLDIFKRQLTEKEGASKSTVKNYLSDVRHFISWYENLMKGSFDLNSVTSEVIRLYEKSMGGTLSSGRLKSETMLSHASMKRHLSSIRKFFFVLEGQDLIASNPFKSIQPDVTAEPTDYWHLRSFKDFLLQKGSSKITIKNYLSDISGFAKWYEETVLPGLDKPLSATQGFFLITQSVLQDYRNRLLEVQNAAPRTINRKLSSLRAYLDFARKKGFITSEEITLDPVQVFENAKEIAKEPTVTLSALKEEPQKEFSYSPIPPVRLAQKLFILPYLSLEDKAANIILGIITGKPVEGIQKLPKSVSQVISAKNQLRSGSRTISNLLGVTNVSKNFYAPDKVSLLGQPLYRKALFHLRYTRPEWYKKYHNYEFVHYAHFALLVIFASGVGVALYNNLVLQKQKQASAAPTAPPRVLSFQGRLTDNVDNPITSVTSLRFAIYNDSAATGGALLWQEVNGVTPDQDGIFSIYLGGGTSIPSTVFTDNSNIYLGVTVGVTSELTPRQRIATVGYATNAEFLQGLPPTTQAGITSFTNVVLALDSSGNLSLSDSSATNHTFQVTNGQFRLAGQGLVLSTNTGSNGNVFLSPDGFGRVDVQKPLLNSTTTGNISSGAVEVNDKFAVLATESAVAAFIVNNSTTGGDILTASSSGTPRFTIANDGTLTSAIYTGQNGVLYGAQTTGVITQATTASTGLCLQSGVSNPTWGSCGGINYWNLSSGSLKPINDTLDLLVGGQTTAAAKFRFLNNAAGTPVASISANSSNNAAFIAGDGTFGTTNRQTLTIGNSSSYNTTGNILINPNGVGQIGINTSSILATLDLRANLINGGTLPVATISGKTSNSILQIDNSGAGDLISASSSGVPSFIVKNNGDVIVGQGGAGKLTAAVVDPYLVQNQKTSGIVSLTFQTMGASNADFIYQNVSTELSRLTQAGQMQLPITGSTGGIVLGGDVQIFRGSADRLDIGSGDSLNLVSGSLSTNGTTRIDSSGNATFTTLNVSGGCTGCTTGAPSPFQVLQGAIAPLNSTLDLLVGSQATTSAKFAIIGVANARGSQTASVSGNLVLDSAGSIQTTNKQTLSIGGNTTGEIQFLANNNTNGLFLRGANAAIGNQSPQAALDVSSSSLISAPTNKIVWGSIGNTMGTLGYDGGSANEIRIGATSNVGLELITNDSVVGYFTNTGNFGVGTTSPTSKLDVAGTASIASTLTFRDGASSIQSSQKNTLTLGGGSTGNILISPLTTTTLQNTTVFSSLGLGIAHISSTGVLSSSAVNLASADVTGILPVANGGSPWNQNDTLGTIFEKNNTLDILVGGTSTTSAKFAVLNIAGTLTPTASVSAQNAGGQALVLGGDGSIQSVRNNTLTIGGSTTGFVTIDSGTGQISLLDNTNLAGNLTGLTGLTLASGAITLGGSTGTGQCLLGGTSASWGSCAGTGFASPFQTGTGSIFALNSTLDFLAGGQASTSAVFRTTGQGNPFAGTTVGASVSANTSFAGFVIDNKGVGDIFTASSSGVTQLRLTNNGSLALGLTPGNLPTAKLDVNGAASISSVLTFRAGLSSIQSSQNNTLTIGGGSTGNIVISPLTTTTLQNTTVFSSLGLGIAHISSTGVLSSSAVNLASADVTGILPVANGGSPWNQNDTLGTIFEKNNTLDILAGGTTTASAKFGVLNVAGGTPTASVSAQNAGGQALVLGGDGSIQSVRNNTLTIGGSTTGFISLDSGSGLISILDNTNITGNLTGLTGLTLASGAITLGGSTGTGLCLLGGASASWGSCTGTLVSSPFEVRNGLIVPGITTLEFLAGGTSTTSAAFRVIGQDNPFRGTLPAASVSANTSWAGFVVDNKGTGDLFTASSAGLPVFRVKNSGDVVIGSAGEGKLTVGIVDPYLIQNQKTTGTTSLTFQTMGASNADFVYQNTSTELSRLTQAGQLQIPITGSTGGIVLGGDVQIFRGAANRIDVGTGDSLNLVSGSIQVGGATVIDSSSNATFSNINLTGVCTGCVSSANSPFQVGSGAIISLNSSLDFLAGGQSSTSAVLKVTGQGNPFAGTSVGASVSANTSFAALVIDNRGIGDIFTASSSGVTQLRLTNNGSLALGLAAGNVPTAKLDVNGAASISSALTFRNGTSAIQSTQNNTLTIGGGSTGNIVISPLTTTTLQNTTVFSSLTSGIAHLSSTGVLSSSAVNLNSSDITGILPIANGGSPWNQNDTLGTIFEKNNTLDILAGGTTTASAKFAVLNVAGGTPTASVSAQNAGGQALVLGGDGSIQSVRNNTLTIGGSTTGLVNIDSAVGAVNILDNTFINGNLTGLTGLTLASGAITLQGSTGTGLCLVGGTTAQWSSCTSGIVSSPFEVRTGVILPGITTLDFLAGGTSSTSAAFRVTGQGNPFKGTLAAATVSADTSFAGLVIDNKGVGDIFTASQSGMTQILLSNNGSLGIGLGTGGRPTAKLDVNGMASISSQLSFRTGAGVIQTTSNNTLTIGGSTTGFITIDSGSGQIAILDNTNIAGNLTGLTGLTLASGAITLAGSTGTSQCLIGGATAQWGSCSTGIVASPFETRNGAIVPGITTLDFLAGGSASTSAAFKVTGQDNPFRGTISAASVSANTSFAGLVIDNKGVGDILTASQAGTTQLLLSSNGSLGLGLGIGGRPTAKLDVNGAASISGILSFRTGTGNITTTANNTLTLGGGATGNVLINPLGAAQFGIGTATPLASIDLRGSLGIINGGTIAVASVSGKTSYATLTVDNFGTGDIFTASSSSNTQFVIAQNGRVGVGNAARIPTAQLDVAGSASISGQLSFRTGLGSIQTTANNQLTLGGSSTGDITLSPRNGSGILNLTLSSTNGLKLNGTFGAALTATNSCVTDIVNGLVTGVATCAGGSGGSNWTLSTATGVIRPNNSTVDFLLGGTSTSSAKFAVLNLNSNTTIATVSGNLIVMPNNGWGGRVGIGAITPTALLHVNDDVNDANVNIETHGTNKAANLSLYSTNSTFGQISHYVSGVKQWTLGNNGDLAAGSFGIYTTSSTVNRVALSPTGNFGIGTATSPTGINPVAQLQVFSTVNQPAASISGKTATPALLVTNDGVGDLIVASSSGLRKFWVEADGTVNYVGGLNAQFSDLAEYFKKANPSEEFLAGQLVCVASTGITKCTNNSKMRIFGVVSDNSMIRGGGFHEGDSNYVLVGLVGQLGVRVSGQIHKGDPLALSSIPGVAVKATGATNVVGYSMEDNADGKIRVASIIQPNYVNQDEVRNIIEYNNLSLNESNGVFSVLSGLGNQIEGLVTFSKATIGELRAGLITAVRGTFTTITAAVSNLGNATASTLAVTTDAMTIGGQNIKDFILDTVRTAGFSPTPLVSPTAQIASLQTDVISPLGNPEVKIAGKLKIEDNLVVTGNSTISGNLAANTATFQTSNSNILTSNTATIAGTLSANNIIANNIEGLDQKLATLAAQINSQKTIDNSQYSSNSAQTNSCLMSNDSCLLSVNSLHANFGIFEQGITSMGPVTATNVTAMDSLNVGAGFTITNNSINTLGGDLALQSLRQANISFQGGLIKMDTDGNMDIAGNLNVLGEIDAVFGVFSGTLTTPALAVGIISPIPGDDLVFKLWDETSSSSSRLVVKGEQNKEVLSINAKGDVVSSGSATFAKLNFNLVGKAEATSLTEAVATGSAGFATLRAYQPEITIKNKNVTSKSLIYITPFGDTSNKVLYLLRQTPQSDDTDGSFTVGVSGPVTTKDVQFNWLIVN